MKPFDAFRAEVDRLQDDALVACRLWCSVEYVRSWRDRERTLPDGRVVVETGIEPSGGFMGAALAILRHTR